jgi:hypothetical protein
MKTNTLLMGPIGTGKTHALKTLLDLGLEVFVLSLEPGIEHVLGDTPPSQCHWKKIFPAVTDFETFRRSLHKASMLTMEQLQRAPGNKADCLQLLEVIDACNDFVCDRTGESFGALDSWGEDRVFAVDGLTGLSQMCSDLIVGDKLIKTQPEWGTAMELVYRTISLWASATKCSFVLLSHIARETDEVTGGTKITLSTLGNKLAPRIPPIFDEVITTTRQGRKFVWSNMENGYDLKGRRLPFGEYTPDFAHIFKGAAA